MKGFYAALVKLLKEHGYTFCRQGKGSHEIWQRGNNPLTVPSNCKSVHTANKILKDAGIKVKL